MRAVQVEGTSYLFGTGADGYIRYLTRTAAGFGIWGKLTGIRVTGEPAPVVLPDGTLRLFATGIDGLVYQRTLSGLSSSGGGGSWGGWGKVDGRITVDSPPAAAVNGSRIDLVARIGGELATTSYLDGSWSAWATVPPAGSITGAPALVAEGGGRIDAFVVPAGGGPVLRTQAVDGVWHPAVQVTGITTASRPEAVQGAGGTQYVFGPDGAEAVGAAGSPTWTDGRLDGAPGSAAAFADASGVGLFVLAPDGTLRYAHTD